MNQYPASQQSATLRPSNTLLIGLIVFLGVALLAVGIFAASRPNAPTCITPDDYFAFYGEEPLESNFEPKISFFQKEYTFIANSAAIDANESDAPSIDAQNLARFYASRTNKPMVFTLAAVYQKDSATSKALADQRLRLLADTLTKADIPADLIKSDISAYTTDESTELPDSSNAASLTLSSAESCTE